jgi:hypothetical protein
MGKYARELRQKEERADRLKILKAFDIKPITQANLDLERDDRKRRLFDHLTRSDAMRKSLAIINCQESRHIAKNIEKNSKHHLAEYMNLLGGTGTQGEGDAKVAADLDRDFNSLGHTFLDSSCVDAANKELYRKRNELNKIAMNDVFERYL